MKNPPTVIPCTPFGGDKGEKQKRCYRQAPQNNAMSPTTIKATDPGPRADRVKMPEDMHSATVAVLGTPLPPKRRSPK